MKRRLYETLMSRMKEAHAAGYHLEACWYAYALLEDRLTSMLESTGGASVESGKNKGQPIRMLGNKLAKLRERAKTNPVLQHSIEFNEIKNWIDRRNDLMHAMADGIKPLKALDKEAFLLAQDGMQIVGKYASVAMRLKKKLRPQAKR